MITSVRARLGDGAWVNLVYNETTGRYEGKVVGEKTSYHEEGGYFPVTVEAVNDSGESATVGADALKALRLVVREESAPALALVSPAPGYLIQNSQTFVFSAQDEEGGSGIDPDTAMAFLDGQESPCTIAEDGDGYTIAIPAEDLPEGPHVVSASISDNDGNETTAAAAYIVDTLPPELAVHSPSLVRVVDAESVTISGEVRDASGVSLTVAGAAVEVIDGQFTASVPLEIGENHIPILATDDAGNGTAAEVYMIRLITDRVPADAERLQELCARGYSRWTAEERAWFAAAKCLRGSYDALDYNRVGVALRYLAQQLRDKGYIAEVSPKTDWTEAEAITRTPGAEYLRDVYTVRDAQGLYLGELPASWRYPTLEGANQIEKAIVAVNAVFPRYRALTSGQITAGIYG